MNKCKIDKSRFIPSVITVALILIIVYFNLETVQSIVSTLYSKCAQSFGWLFIIADLAALGFTFWMIFGRYKDKKLGGDDAVPKYKVFSWAAMMFTTCCSAGLSVFCFIEPIIYSSSSVPMHGDPLTTQSYEVAQMYTHFHWGLNAWCLYVPITIAIGYALYNRGNDKMTVSSACDNILGGKKILGCSIDVCSIVGGLMAPVVSMGLGMPVLTALLRSIFGLGEEYTRYLQIIILVIWMVMFCTSLYRGLDRGIKVLSNINVVTFFIFIFVIGCLAGLPFVLKSELSSFGMYVNNFIRLSTYTDPYGDGAFVRDWTIFYWAWFMVYIPLMGVFNAKISKGRKFKEIAIAQMMGSSIGSWLAMALVGNYGIKLQMSGQLDIASILQSEGNAGAIVAILGQMPAAKLMMIIMSFLVFLFMATTVDSSSLVTAESTILRDDPDAMAPRNIRFFWAIVTCITTGVLLLVGGFSAVQTLAVLAGLPIAIVSVVILISLLKTFKDNYK